MFVAKACVIKGKKYVKHFKKNGKLQWLSYKARGSACLEPAQTEKRETLHIRTTRPVLYIQPVYLWNF